MPKKKTVKKPDARILKQPTQAEIARIVIDITDVNTSKIQNLLVETLEPLGLEEDKLRNLISQVTQIGSKSKDNGMTQLLSLYK